MTNESEVSGLFQWVKLEHGRLDILVNVVGAYSGGKEVWNSPVEEWDNMMRMTFGRHSYAAVPPSR